MVSFLAEVKILSFWPKTMDVAFGVLAFGVLTEIEVIVCSPFTPHWKVLRS